MISLPSVTLAHTNWANTLFFSSFKSSFPDFLVFLLPLFCRRILFIFRAHHRPLSVTLERTNSAKHPPFLPLFLCFFFPFCFSCLPCSLFFLSDLFMSRPFHRPFSVMLAESDEEALVRHLTLFDLVVIGVAGTVGSGIFGIVGLSGRYCEFICVAVVTMVTIAHTLDRWSVWSIPSTVLDLDLSGRIVSWSVWSVWSVWSSSCCRVGAV